jgi:hypothetical protein
MTKMRRILTADGAKSLRALAPWWLVLGAVGLLFSATMFFGHYIFGMPVHYGHTGRLATPSEINTTCGAMAAGFGFFAGLGGWLRLAIKPD